MPWSDFEKVWTISTVQLPCFEEKDHQLEITGDESRPVVACRTRGCLACYHDAAFTAAGQITGKLETAPGTKHSFTITYNPAYRRIECTIKSEDRIGSGTTGSWTADDRGPDDGGGERKPHRS